MQLLMNFRMRPQTRQFLVFFIASLWALWMTSAAADILKIQPDNRHVNPVFVLETLEDRTNTMSFQEILSPDIQAKFTKNTAIKQGALNFGFTDATYWIKLTISRSPEALEDWILEVPYLNLDAMTFYAPGRPPLQVGTSFSSNNKPIFYPLYALPITLTVEPQTFYLKVKSQYAITVPITLWSRTAFTREYADTLLIQALYFGGLLSLALYNFLLFLSLKDRSYLLYTLFALTMGMGTFAGNGYGRLYFWPESAAWDTVSQTTIYSLAGALSLWFASSFLRTRQTFPRIHRCFNSLALVYLMTSALFVSSILLDFSPATLFQVFLLITLPAALTTVLAAVLTFRNGNRSALYFLFAYGALWVGAVVGMLRAFDVLPSNGLTLYALQIGSSFEMLLLSFSLAYRIHHEREQRIQAQEAVINARNDLLRLAQENEAQLESKVAERSIKLQQVALNEINIRQQYVRFGAMIAHEFRNPLGIIETQSTLMQRENQQGINKVDDRAETIISASRRLTALFDQWLKSDQLQQPISKIHATPIDLAELVEPALRTARSFHRDRSIVSEPIPIATLSGDIGLLEIALLNLIDNACKYSPTDEPVSISFKHREHQIGIVVSDRGPGLPTEKHQEIFKPYVRAGDTTAKPGIGLGLAFVAHIADLHNGEIEISSRPQKGSQFCIWIPSGNQ